MSDHYFGLVKRDDVVDGKANFDEKGNIQKVPGLTGMKRWREGIDKARARTREVNAEEQDADFALIAKWLADQAKPREKRDLKKLAWEGQIAFTNDNNKCSGCHSIDILEKDPKDRCTSHGAATQR